MPAPSITFRGPGQPPQIPSIIFILNEDKQLAIHRPGLNKENEKRGSGVAASVCPAPVCSPERSGSICRRDSLQLTPRITARAEELALLAAPPAHPSTLAAASPECPLMPGTHMTLLCPVEGPHPWPAQSAPPVSRVGSCLKAGLCVRQCPQPGEATRPSLPWVWVGNGLEGGRHRPRALWSLHGQHRAHRWSLWESRSAPAHPNPGTCTAQSARLPPPGRLQGLTMAQMALAQQNRFSWDTPRGESTGSDTGWRPGAWQCQGALGLSGVLGRHPAVGEQSPSLQKQEHPVGQGASPLPGSHPASALLQSPQEAALHNSSQAMDPTVTRHGQGKGQQPHLHTAISQVPSKGPLPLAC